MPQTFVYPFTKMGEGIYMPLVPVVLHNPIDNAATSVMALLDTGASDCVFPQYIADYTKHNLKADGVESSITQGVGDSKVKTWKHTFNIHLVSPDKRQVIWKSKNIMVGCLDHNSAPPLLGWTCFLSNFKITFNYPTKKIIIEIP